MTNAVAELKTGGDIAAIVPTSATEVQSLAVMIAQSGMAPKGMERPEKIAVAIIAGMEAGLTPLDAVNSIAVINGRPSMWGDALMGLVMGSGLVEDLVEEITGQGENMEAKCSIRRKGIPSPTVRTFSVDDAKMAGLWNKQGPWKQYPKRMLQVRARAFALRDLFPDVLRGIGIREEIQDHRDFMPNRSHVSNPVSVKEIAGKVDVPEDQEPEEAEVLETLSSDRAQEILQAVANIQTSEDYSTIVKPIVDELKPLAETPLKTSVGKAIKAKQAELKEANSKQQTAQE